MAGCQGRFPQLNADGCLKGNNGQPTALQSFVAQALRSGCPKSVHKFRTAEVGDRASSGFLSVLPSGPNKHPGHGDHHVSTIALADLLSSTCSGLAGPLRRGSHDDRESADRSALSSRSLRPHAMRCGISGAFLIRGRHRVVRHHAVRPLGRHQ